MSKARSVLPPSKSTTATALPAVSKLRVDTVPSALRS